MADYVYNNSSSYVDVPSYIDPEQEHDTCIPETPQASTTLDELDQLEIINRNADEFNKIVTPDNPYPDVLKKPIYTRTIPETVIQSSNQESLKPIPKKALKDMSINEFATTIANSLIEIINDLLKYRPGDNFTDIFTKDSRLLSIGVLLLIISVFFIFFKNVE